jgi:pilus assembly protein Flp/PilA
MLQLMCWFQTGLGSMVSRVATLREEERGQALVEYGLILALIAAVCIALILTLGKQISDTFVSITGSL